MPKKVRAPTEVPTPQLSPKSRSDIPRNARRKEQSVDRERIGNLAMKVIPRMESCGGIKKLPMKLSKEVFHPVVSSDGVQFCVGCGKHGVFRLRDHIVFQHPEVKRGTDLYKMFEQVGRGFLERMKGASVNLERIPAPVTPRECEIFNAFKAQIYEGGIPMLGSPHASSSHLREEEIACDDDGLCLEAPWNDPSPSIEDTRKPAAIARSPTKAGKSSALPKREGGSGKMLKPKPEPSLEVKPRSNSPGSKPGGKTELSVRPATKKRSTRQQVKAVTDETLYTFSSLP